MPNIHRLCDSPAGVGFPRPGLESSESSLSRLTLLDPGAAEKELTGVCCMGCTALVSITAGEDTMDDALEPTVSSCFIGTCKMHDCRRINEVTAKYTCDFCSEL